ncbi:MAG: restriction endonuclease subunit S [Gemmatimonadetes bacterium]|nr:restriction endonuclease subunit S [Gemmatimonadota bacterium]MBK6844000.1 restriction endonuclease subunit S [Gemmatimonadota bacterium]
MNDRASAVTLAAIGDIAEVRPGLSTGERLEHKDGATWQVILSRHLVPGQPYRFTDADRFTIDPERDAARYRVHVGDVLFMSRGTRNVASWIKSIPEDSVAPVSFYILRPGPAVEPGYLTWWLNQPVAQRTIADIRTGAGTPIVQRKSFAELQLPLPTLAEQRIIAQLGQAMTQERVVLEQLAAATERLHLLTSDHIARDLLARVEPHDDE